MIQDENIGWVVEVNAKNTLFLMGLLTLGVLFYGIIGYILYKVI